MKEKLVRDYIPRIIKEDGRNPQWRVAEPQEVLGLLIDKLGEEIDELIKSESKEERKAEAGDVLEVTRSIFKLFDVSLADSVVAAHNKRTARGGFDERIVLTLNEETR